MGRISNSKIILVVFCLLLTSVLVYWQPDSKAAKKRLTLSESLSGINGWSAQGLALEQKIVRSLDLDDYVNLNFSNGSETVLLYIGYYLTSKKVGAAHSPLVCFPGQGWALSDGENESLTIGKEKINYSIMIASIGTRKELLIFWFQAFDRTSPGTFFQKINTLWSKFHKGRTDNAFVRITVPIRDKSVDEAHDTGINFIEAFYPSFLDYVKENQS